MLLGMLNFIRVWIARSFPKRGKPRLAESEYGNASAFDRHAAATRVVEVVSL